MPLQGDAKREYMREYHRRKRAGLPTKAAEDDVPWCNFCGCTLAERVLVKAPDDAPYPAHICAQCVECAADAVAQRRGPWWR